MVGGTRLRPASRRPRRRLQVGAEGWGGAGKHALLCSLLRRSSGGNSAVWATNTLLDTAGAYAAYVAQLLAKHSRLLRANVEENGEEDRPASMGECIGSC